MESCVIIFHRSGTATIIGIKDKRAHGDSNPGTRLRRPLGYPGYLMGPLDHCGTRYRNGPFVRPIRTGYTNTPLPGGGFRYLSLPLRGSGSRISRLPHGPVGPLRHDVSEWSFDSRHTGLNIQTFLKPPEIETGGETAPVSNLRPGGAELKI